MSNMNAPRVFKVSKLCGCGGIECLVFISFDALRLLPNSADLSFDLVKDLRPFSVAKRLSRKSHFQTFAKNPNANLGRAHGMKY